jgi:hypothetical protein
MGITKDTVLTITTGTIGVQPEAKWKNSVPVNNTRRKFNKKKNG